ncbi:MAG: MFS transporter, partial [Firmicutes bacterium]|nr:MFS transporter [Bacillota bacterium]
MRKRQPPGMRRHIGVFGIAIAVMVLFGASDMMRGVAAPFLLRDMHLNYLLLGTAFSAASGGYLVASFTAGFVTHHFGIKRSVLYGFAVMIAGYALIVLAHDYALLVIGFVLSGIGSGLTEIGVNSLVPALAPDAQSHYFNVLHAMYSLGATVSPVVLAWLIAASGTWRTPGALFVLAYACLCLPGLRMPYPRSPGHSDAHESEHAKLGSIVRQPVLYVLICSIGIYVVAESGVANWLPTLLRTTRHESVAVAALYLSGFYLLLTAGRFAGGAVVARIGGVRAVILSSLSGAAILWLLQVDRDAPAALYAVSGLFFGFVFPTISAVTSETFAERSATVLGFLFTCAGIGGMVSSWLIGAIADTYGLAAGFGVVPVSLLATALLMMAYPAAARRRQRSR